MVACDGSAGLNGLDRTDLVVGVHDADEHGVGGDHPPKVVGIDEAGAVDRQPRHARPELLKERSGAMTAGCSTDDVMKCDRSVRLAEKTPFRA
jgi:hypothetical protein